MDKNKQKIAEAAGWHDESVGTLIPPLDYTESADKTPAIADTSLLDSDDWVKPEQVNTKPPFWSRPLPRIIMLGIPSAVVLSMFLSLVSGNRGKQATLPQGQIMPHQEQTGEKASEQKIKDLESEVEDYKTKNALQTQTNRLKEQQESPPSSFQAVAVTRSSPFRSQPVTVKALPPRSVSRPQPRSIGREPILRSTPRKTLTPSIKNPIPQGDPMEQWLAAANLGSYGSLSASSYQPEPASNYPTSDSRSEWEVAGGLGSASTPINSNPVVPASYTREPDSLSTNNSTPSRQEILVGTRASGRLETPIAWTGNLRNPSQNFLIKLTEPIKGADGEVVVPAGAYLTAQVIEATNTGLLQMSAGSILLTHTGRSSEKPIPAGSMLILGGGGGILKAEAHSADTVGNDILASLLSGVSSAAALINRPRSQSFTNLGGSTDYGQPDYLAGFVQGTAQSAVQAIQQRNQQARASLQSQPTVFVLDQGTDVQIFINQTINFEF